jgi:UDP-N-acetylglucosamine--N-acetylmuramyl-(pentapeptide) pyrophosphoryl-undecaprenol N-acetylglucosamine transferase
MLERAGGAIMVDQVRFTPGNVAAEIARLAAAPDKLAEMAAAAKAQGVLDAADRLADLVMRVAGIAAAPASRTQQEERLQEPSPPAQEPPGQGPAGTVDAAPPAQAAT